MSLQNLPSDVLNLIADKPGTYWRLAITVKGFATEKVVEKKKHQFITEEVIIEDNYETNITYLDGMQHSFGGKPSWNLTRKGGKWGTWGTWSTSMWHNYDKLHRDNDEPSIIDNDGSCHFIYHHRDKVLHDEYYESSDVFMDSLLEYEQSWHLSIMKWIAFGLIMFVIVLHAI